ncbi:hypothetical protein HELRODRAFT_81089, partial [Helobdella robusta]|uniref:Leptin receptor overlapping transcript-like 1 n=1 Tax=Helobdella robusta TaxID=6412 RepID=T1G489_HELRO
LVSLAFLASAGITFLVLGCALPQYNNWWMMFVLIFYFLSPIPSLISRRFAETVESSNALIEICIFITTCIFISAFGLPIVLAHKDIVKWGACGLVLAGNVVVFSTIFLFFVFFAKEDSFQYSSW